jgi:uncharacterized membrane protein YphA (DoxX/SURF4 family)
MFPAGRPGIALLLLRTALGVMLLVGVPGRLANHDSPWMLLPLWTVAIALCVGFLTPVTSLLCAAFEAAAWHWVGGAPEAIHACAILIGVALAMLGPGAYSLDASLFGRRQVIFPPSDDG